MFKLEKIYILRNICVLREATHLKKLGCFTRISSVKHPQTTVCKHLGIEETSCWTFGKGTFPILRKDSSYLTVLALLCWIFNLNFFV